MTVTSKRVGTLELQSCSACSWCAADDGDRTVQVLKGWGEPETLCTVCAKWFVKVVERFELRMELSQILTRATIKRRIDKQWH